MRIRKWSDIDGRGHLAFLVGAGASRNAPADLPTAPEYILNLLDTVAGTDPLLRAAVRQLANDVWGGNPACRLEVVLDLLREGRGLPALRLVDAFDGGIPNAIHYFLAKQLHLRRPVITTNFDGLIERAYRDLFPGRKLDVILSDSGCKRRLASRSRLPLLFKIHGSCRDARGRRSTQSIVATLHSLANGLAKPRRALLYSIMRSRSIVVVGYSGRDGFDISPAMLAPSAPRTTFFWISHTTRGFRVVDGTRAARLNDPPVEDVLRAHPRSVVIATNTASFLVGSRRWPGTAGAPSTRTWDTTLKARVSDLQPSESDRLVFLAKLLQYNGHLTLAKRLLLWRRASSRGLARAYALDDLAQLAFFSRDFGADIRLRNASRRLSQSYRGPVADLLRARAWLGAAEAYRHQGRYGEALRGFRSARVLFGRLGLREKIAYADLGRAGILRMTSRFGDAHLAYDASARNFRRARDIRGALACAWGKAELTKYEGRISEAESLYARVEKLSREAGHQSLAAWAIVGSADLLRASWNLREAQRRYAHAINVFPPQDVDGRAWAAEGFVQTALLLDRASLRACNAVIAQFKRSGARLGLVAAKLDRARLLFRAGRVRAALRELQAIGRQRLPKKDRLNVMAAKAVIIAGRHPLRARHLTGEAANGFRQLGMIYSAVNAIASALAVGVSLNSRDVRWAARAASGQSYAVEAAAIRDALRGRPFTYQLNLL